MTLHVAADESFVIILSLVTTTVTYEPYGRSGHASIHSSWCQVPTTSGTQFASHRPFNVACRSKCHGAGRLKSTINLRINIE